MILDEYTDFKNSISILLLLLLCNNRVENETQFVWPLSQVGTQFYSNILELGEGIPCKNDLFGIPCRENYILEFSELIMQLIV